jgi:hypothetical protein
MDEILSRAFSAYFRNAKRQGYTADQPSEHRSGAEEVDGRDYVVLRNSHQTLAVYRVRNDGMLKALKRWPAELDRS